MNFKTILNLNSLPGAALLLTSLTLSPQGCVATKVVVLPQNAPVRLAADVDAEVEYDDGPVATPGHPHVEHWVKSPGKQTLHTGEYVIRRVKPPVPTTLPLQK